MQEENKILKEEFTKKVNIQSILTHQSADGKVGGSFELHRTFLELQQQNSVAEFSRTTEVDGDLFLKCPKKSNTKNIKWLQELSETPEHQRSQINFEKTGGGAC